MGAAQLFKQTRVRESMSFGHCRTRYVTCRQSCATEPSKKFRAGTLPGGNPDGCAVSGLLVWPSGWVGRGLAG